MNVIFFLIAFPFLAAVLLAVTGNNSARKAIVFVSCALLIAASVSFSAQSLLSGETMTLLKETHSIDLLMLAGEIFLMCLIVFLGFKYKKYYVALLSVVQTGLIMYLELTGQSESTQYHIFVDRLSVIMCLIIGIVGCLICVYAAGYMTDYHHHHKEYTDRRKFFFGMLFVFLGAMFGLVLSSNLIWIYFFWEITSVSSFLLIGYTRTQEAIDNSFRALWMNLLGGLGFAIAIAYSILELGVFNLQDLLAGSQNPMLLIPIILLAFAGLTKSAQLPFSKWLLGAMVAPTPTSALLHSATMVKAGVYLLLRLAPAMQGNIAGYMVGFVGGFTFLMTSMLAITHSDGKKVLAYSTISNLGLITACAGVGTAETVWAGILLMIFHAVSKSMLFQGVGAIENATGSRDIEDMHGLIIFQPKLAFIMMIGIAGMFLAPFGMLISKWAALKAFIDSGSILFVFFVAFGSATTLFYWTKWLGKILAVNAAKTRQENTTSACQWVSLYIHAVVMIAICALLPYLSEGVLVPLLKEMFFGVVPALLSISDMFIMIIMLALIFVIPCFVHMITKGKNYDTTLTYMNGVNSGNNYEYINSFGESTSMFLSNWYMKDLFGEQKLWAPSVIISSVAIIVLILFTVGGAV